MAEPVTSAPGGFGSEQASGLEGLSQVFFRVLLFLCFSSYNLGLTLAVGSEPVLYGIGNREESSLFYRIDLESKEANVVGSLLFPDCLALAAVAPGKFVTVCHPEGPPVLVEIDALTAAATRLAEIVDPELQPAGLGASLSITDLAIDRQGNLFAIAVQVGSFPGIPPVSMHLYQLDLLTGQLAMRRDFQSARSGLAFHPGNDALYSTTSFNAATMSNLERIDVNTGQVQDSVPLDMLGFYEGLDFHPQTAALYAVNSISSNPAPGLISRIMLLDPESGQAVIQEQFPFRITDIAWTQDRVSTGVQQLIFPVVSSLQLGSRQLLTSFSLLNASNTTASPTLQLFTSAGDSVPLSQALCPNPADNLPVVRPRLVGDHQVETFIVRPDSGFDGWAREVWLAPTPLDGNAEIHLLDARVASCPAPGAYPATLALSSSEVLTLTGLKAVAPSTRFYASADILRNRESAFAIVNPSATDVARVTIQAFREDGTSFDSNEVSLGPLERLSDLLFGLLIRGKVFVLPPQRPTDFKGMVEITSDLPIAVSGIQVLFPEGKWSDIPVHQSEGSAPQ